MTVKRSAYTLMEILAVIAAIVIFTTLSAKAFRTLASDIPRANRDFQVWLQSEAMIESIKADVESAVSMDLKEVGSQPAATQLLLQLPQEIVIYTLANGKVDRTTPTSQMEWELPHFQMRWSLWEGPKSPYAVEISTWMERTVLNNAPKKYEQAFVFFLEPQGVKP